MKTKYTDEFEKFWYLYPRRWVESSGQWVKIGKYEAFVAWKRISKQERVFIMTILPKLKSNRYTPDASRWLKKRRWEDFEQSAKKVADFKRPTLSSSKTPDMVHSDKVRKQIDKLSDSMKV